MRRRLIELASKAMQQAYDDTCDINSDIDTFSVELLKLKEGLSQDVSIDEIANQNMTQIRKVKSGEIERYGIPTKLNDLDNVINGLIAPDLIILAGRPGMGKTALAMTIIKNVAITQQIPVGVFSLEMGAEQLEIRLKSMVSGVSGSRALRGNISDMELHELEKATAITEIAPIYINDKSSLKISDVRSKAIEWRATYGIQLIVLDYIQLMGDRIKGQTRDQEIGAISGGLKRLAKELGIPIIALSQLNRDVEKRNPPEPRLSDLRESGSLEADADIVFMLYRPEYYDIQEVNFKGEQVPTKNLCFLSIEKHRNGATGTIALGCNLATSHFYDYGVKSDYNADQWIEKENAPW
jgi:replicative DNA helicase